MNQARKTLVALNEMDDLWTSTILGKQADSLANQTWMRIDSTEIMRVLA